MIYGRKLYLKALGKINLGVDERDSRLHAIFQFRFWTFFHLYSALIGTIVGIARTSPGSHSGAAIISPLDFLEFWAWSQGLAAVVEMFGGLVADRVSLRSIITFGQCMLAISIATLGAAIIPHFWPALVATDTKSLIILNQCFFGIGIACFAGKDSVLAKRALDALGFEPTLSGKDSIRTKIENCSETRKSIGNAIAATVGSVIFFGILYFNRTSSGTEKSIKYQAGAALIVLVLTLFSQIIAIRITRRLKNSINTNAAIQTHVSILEIFKCQSISRAILVSGTIEALFSLMSTVSVVSVFSHILNGVLHASNENWALFWALLAPGATLLIFGFQTVGAATAKDHSGNHGTAEGWSFFVVASCLVLFLLKFVFSVCFAYTEPRNTAQANTRASQSQEVDFATVRTSSTETETTRNSFLLETTGAPLKRTLEADERALIMLVFILASYMASEFGRTNIRVTLKQMTFRLLSDSPGFQGKESLIMSLPGTLAKIVSVASVLLLLCVAPTLKHVLHSAFFPSLNPDKDTLFKIMLDGADLALLLMVVLVVFFIISRALNPRILVSPIAEKGFQTVERKRISVNQATVYALAVAAIVTSNFLGLFSLNVRGIPMQFYLGAVPYAIGFSLFDVVMEAYGKDAARALRRACIGSYLFCFFVAACVHGLSLFSEKSDWLKMHAMNYYALLIGSACSFIISQTLNSRLFFFLKFKAAGSYLAARCLLSTFVAQIFDTVVFVYVASFCGFETENIPVVFGQLTVKWLLGVLSLGFVLPYIRFLRRRSVLLNKNPA